MLRLIAPVCESVNDGVRTLQTLALVHCCDVVDEKPVRRQRVHTNLGCSPHLHISTPQI